MPKYFHIHNAVMPKMALPGVGWFARGKDTEGNSFSLMQEDSSNDDFFRSLISKIYFINQNFLGKKIWSKNICQLQESYHPVGFNGSDKYTPDFGQL